MLNVQCSSLSSSLMDLLFYPLLLLKCSTQFMQAQFVKAENNVKELSLSVDMMKNESRKLLERAALAERDMKYGHTELM